MCNHALGLAVRSRDLFTHTYWWCVLCCARQVGLDPKAFKDVPSDEAFVQMLVRLYYFVYSLMLLSIMQN